ncbi:protein of unknown function [Ralstonia solanacearum CFBP2957]|nr:hypothetical protein [Ralstonia solanacearum]CBJ42395.1 protein of unknown function [Ralstonia solanacearum CFBP2957]
MITRGYFIGQVIDELTAVSQQVKSRAGLQLFDLNRYLEDFFKDTWKATLATSSPKSKPGLFDRSSLRLISL